MACFLCDTLYFSHFLSATRDLACTGGRTSKTLMKCTRYIAIYFRWHSWLWRLLMKMTQLFEKLLQENLVLFIMVASRKSNFFSDLLISIQWNGGHVGVPSQSCGCESRTLPSSTLPFVSYICIDAGYVRSIPWSKSSAKESFKVEWESGWSNWAMIRKFSTFDDVLLQRASWPFYCVTCSLFTDPIFSLKEPLRYRMKNRGGFIDRESMRQGARVGTGENVLSFSFSPSALTDCRKGKKKTSVYRLTNMVHNSHKNYSLRSRFTQVPC